MQYHFVRLHDRFRPIAVAVFTKASELADAAGLKLIVVSSYRDPRQQMSLFRQGREPGADGAWTKVGKTITNAMPHQTPHCMTVRGRPAACAIDFALLLDGQYLPDADERWSIIGDAVQSQAHLTAEWGGKWRMRDMGHVELLGWRRLPR